MTVTKARDSQSANRRNGERSFVHAESEPEKPYASARFINVCDWMIGNRTNG